MACVVIRLNDACQDVGLFLLGHARQRFTAPLHACIEECVTDLVDKRTFDLNESLITDEAIRRDTQPRVLRVLKEMQKDSLLSAVAEK